MPYEAHYFDCWVPPPHIFIYVGCVSIWAHVEVRGQLLEVVLEEGVGAAIRM